jgi:Flp pilus assembly pilin Flp
MKVLNDQRGAAAVEFALAVLLFGTALMAIIEFSRIMLLWGTASEATRIAARIGSVCSIGSATEAHARDRVDGLIETSGQVNLAARSNWLVLGYAPAGCTEASCTMVTARLSGLAVQLDIPGFRPTISLPDFVATTPREAMSSVVANTSNAACG